MRDRTEITIAIVGGNTVAGLALSFLLRGAGYETIILKTPPTGPEGNLLPAIEEELFGAESSGATWPVEIGGLARTIEAALGGKVEIGPAIVANPIGETALP